MGVVILVRHGQASFGADDYDVLSETGWEQGRRLGAWLRDRGVKPATLVRGTMRRHRETAEALQQGAAGWPEAGTDPAWDEFDHLAVVAAYPEAPEGPLDQRAFQEVFELATARWTSGEGEYAEPWSSFRARAVGALDAACARAGSGETAVVVTSGGPIAAACAAVVDRDADDATFGRLWSRFNTTIVNASFTRIVVGSTGARLLTFNEHPHLEGEHLTYR